MIAIAELAQVPRLYGEPITELPKDLYIPPDALEIILEAFEGPLDLLLYLIRKANINILDIPMAQLTAQYLEYVEAMRVRNLELAAEYLLMAAILLEIKSRMLLPRPKRVQEEEVDPRAELVRRLLEYEQMKLAAANLEAMPQATRDYEWVGVWVADRVTERLPEMNLHDLQVVWLGLMKRARVMQHHRVKKEELSVREHMSRILRRLKTTNGYVEFQDLFDVAAGVAGLVVTFLAVLELVRENLIEASQREAFASIYVKASEGEGHEPG